MRHQLQNPQDLERWFSSPRIDTYSHHPDPAGLYAWNFQLAAAYFEVIGHVEVLLRNFISDRLQAVAMSTPLGPGMTARNGPTLRETSGNCARDDGRRNLGQT